MSILGVDLSHFQGQPNFAAVKASGRAFVVLKATEGTSYTDPVFAVNRRAAHAAGLLVGIYHFGAGGDPAAEAAWFLRNVGALAVGEFLVLDDEVPAITPAWAQAWCRAVTAATTVHPLVYMNQSTRDTGNWSGVVGDNDGLWLAKYDGSLAQPSGGPWGGPAMKQYTSTGAVAGIAGQVDLDVFYGTTDQLAAYGLHSPGGFLMALTDAQQADLYQKVCDNHGWLRGGDPNVDNLTLLWMQLKQILGTDSRPTPDPNRDRLGDLYAMDSEILAGVAALTAALQALAAAPGGLSADEITAAAKAGADAALAELGQKLTPAPAPAATSTTTGA